MSGLVLSLFPGADLLGMAFEAEGFCVVRGPDALLGGDVRGWHVPSGYFDGVIGGPPCPYFSKATIGHAPLTGNLIPEFERIVREAAPAWFVMEQVPDSPPPSGATWSEVIDALALGAEQVRRRRISSNLRLAVEGVVFVEPDAWPTITATEQKYSSGASDKNNRRRAGRKVGRRMTLAEVNRAMGLPETFETPALTVAASYAVRGNGVPLPMGRAIARAVKRAVTAAQGVAA